MRCPAGVDFHRIRRDAWTTGAHADRTARKHQIVPQVNEQRSVHVGQDVGRAALLQHDLVHARAVGTRAKIEYPPGRRRAVATATAPAPERVAMSRRGGIRHRTGGS